MPRSALREQFARAATRAGANSALADTGTVVLGATAAALRLASSPAARHFILLDSRKILPDHLADGPLLRRLHQRCSFDFTAFITRSRRTADPRRARPT